MINNLTPVIIGVGEICNRSKDPALGQEPIDLMAMAVRAAEADAGAAVVGAIDSIDIVCEYSWPYPDAPALLAERLAISPKRKVYGPAGGESPVRYIHEAALRIARGESVVSAVVGAEATYTLANAFKTGVNLPWSPRDDNAKLMLGKDMCSEIAVRHGITEPVTIYPLYENASHAAWGQTQREARTESALLWSRYSALAAENPNAWLKKTFSPEEIATPSESNRLIAWPYTKMMVANPMVNMGAAVILTSLGEARRLGIAEDKLVFIWGGAAANEPRDYLQRDQFVRSHAQDVVLETALAVAGGDAARFSLMELYSCFPVVPKMARRTLGIAADRQMTCTGGLSFFGAPLNNYMTHATAGLVRGLRARPDTLGLLYGQGEFVTKHHALVLASKPAVAGLTEDYRVQEAADARRGPVPAMTNDYTGAATLETFTIVYDRAGQAEFGAVIGRTMQGQRLMARVESSDTRTINELTELDTSPIGRRGEVLRGDNNLLIWRNS